MAHTRKMLKAMGIEDEKADEIIEAHAETMDAHRKSAVKRRLTRSFRLICKSALPLSRALLSDKLWCSLWGSNPRPFAPEANALIH